MSLSIGALEFEFLANVARLRQDMEDVKKAVGGATDHIAGAVELAKKAFIGFAGVASVAAFVGMIKGAIEANEALHDLAITTGNSEAALGAFRSIGALSATSLDSISAASIKLSKNLATQDEEGKGAAAALKAIGLNFEDFTRLNPDERMLEVAKALNEYEDGADKAAAAQLFFGKEGAKLLPFLKDLAEDSDKVSAVLTDQEKELRRTQAAMADAFGDNLTRINKNSNAWKKDLATGLTPALYEVSQAFIDVTNGSGGLKEEISKLAKDGTIAEWARTGVIVVSYFADAIQGLWKTAKVVFDAVGTYIGTTIAQWGTLAEAFVQAANGDFSGAWNTIKAGALATKDAIVGVGERAANSFSEETFGSKLRSRLGELKGLGVEAKEAKKHLDLADVLNKTKDATVKLTDEEKKLIQQFEAAVKAGEKLIDTLDGKTAALEAEFRAGRKLTDTEKEHLKLTQDIDNNTIALTISEIEQARATITLNGELDAQIKLMEAQDKAAKTRFDSLGKETDALKDQVEKQRDSNIAIGKSAEELERLKIQELLATAATKDRLAALFDEVDWTGQTSQAYRDQAKELRTLADLKDQGIHLRAAQESAAEWKKTTDSIYNGLTDSLYRAFESGKGFFQTFWDGIKNVFKTTILKIAVQAVANPIQNALGGLLGSSSGGGLGGLFGNIFGGGNSDFVGPLQPGQTAPAAGGLLGGLGGLASLAGPIGLGVTGAVALFKYLKSKEGGPKIEGGFWGQYDAAGALAGTGARAGLSGGDPWHTNTTEFGKSLQGVVSGVAQSYFNTVKALGGNTQGITFGTDADSDPKGTTPTRLWGNINDASGRALYRSANVNIDRNDPAKFQAALDTEAKRILLVALQATQFSGIVSKFLSSVDARTADTAAIDKIIQQVSIIKNFSDTLANADPMAKITDAFRKDVDTLGDTFRANQTGIESLIASYNGSADSIVNLANATNTYYDSQVKLLAQLQQVREGVNGLFDGTLRNFKLAGLDTAGKNALYSQEIADAYAKIQGSTNATEIQKLAGEINNAIQAQFGLLSGEDQAAKANEFYARLETIQHDTDDRLKTLQESEAAKITETLDKLREIVKGQNAGVVEAINNLNAALVAVAQNTSATARSVDRLVVETQLAAPATP